jgi:hypothetical protein
MGGKPLLSERLLGTSGELMVPFQQDPSSSPEHIVTPPEDEFDLTFTMPEPGYELSCDTISWEALLGITPEEPVEEPTTFFPSPSPPPCPKPAGVKRKAASKSAGVELADEYVDSGRDGDKDRDYMPFGDKFGRKPFTRMQATVKVPTQPFLVQDLADAKPKSKRKANQARVCIPLISIPPSRLCCA